VADEPWRLELERWTFSPPFTLGSRFWPRLLV
jgi:hypothetical protein